MPRFGKRIDGVGGRRRAERKSTLLPAMVITITSTGESELINLSATGAKLRTAGEIAEGQEVVVKAAGVEAFATVVWRRGDLVGVTFDEPLGRTELAHLRREGGRAVQTHMTPDEQAAADRWFNGNLR